MPYRTTPLITGEYYHIYNRGINKQKIFITSRDYQRFTQTFLYYQIQNPKPKFSRRGSSLFKIDPSKKIVDIICYCLMPDHFHLLVKQVQDNGISEFMRKFTHSYTKYWNVKNKAQGPILQAMFKAVLVESDEQLLHLSRYIHLNPLVSSIVEDLNLYFWSSYNSYIGLDNQAVEKEEILKFFKTLKDYEQFVLDQADYGTSLELLKHSTLDINE
ncbi:MAG: transposase [Candidatus Daviesbacteria bacterium]